MATAVSVLTGSWGSALARPAGPAANPRPWPPAAPADRIAFTHWTVRASGGGASLSQQVPPGGTLRICSSSKLTELDAHYRATIRSGSRVSTVWKVTGQAATSSPGKVFPKGYFYVASNHGLALGTWRLRVLRRGKTLGSSSVRISPEHC